MARMRAIDAAVAVLRKEGIDTAFGIPGAAINPLYSALRADGGIRHILARHVEGASHMAEGYTRAKPGNIGVCIGTSGPAGTDMITGLYSASADSIQSSASPGKHRVPACTRKISRPWTSNPSPSRSPSGRSPYSSRHWSRACSSRPST